MSELLTYTILFWTVGLSFFQESPKQSNTKPVVRILEPLPATMHPGNEPLRYRIEVTDAEDGASRYEEIASQEVFMEVIYAPDAARAVTIGNQEPERGLAAMMQSNCFTCHGLKDKLIAPSLTEISRRYPRSESTTKLLVTRILWGSAGLWGSASMPSHEEIDENTARTMADWIMNQSADPNRQVMTGLEGILRLTTTSGLTGAYILRATYTDHGSGNPPVNRLIGKDVVLLYP